jgi:AraC family transcriptional regulator
MTGALDPPEAQAGALERPVWKRVHGLWQPLYGGFTEQGVSIEWHDFQLVEPLAWSDSFHEESLEICLNYTGEAELGSGKGAQGLGAGQLAIYATRSHRPVAARLTDSMHRFVTLELSAGFLQDQFSTVLDGLLPGVRRFLENPRRFEPWLEIGSLPSTLLASRRQLLEPPVNNSALGVWYQSKVLEVLAQTLFQPDKPAELFCHRHKRLNKERVERVKYLIERDLENPPNLEMLAAEVDCSPFYLSRLFSEEAGLSMPKYLRLKRVERAAEWMLSRGMNVTEAAMAVGYSSLSAFQKAFAEQFGMSPGNYLSQAGTHKTGASGGMS